MKDESEKIHPSAFIHCVSALEGTRTPGLQVRNLSLYPLSYERTSRQSVEWQSKLLHSSRYYTPQPPALSRRNARRSYEEKLPHSLKEQRLRVLLQRRVPRFKGGQRNHKDFPRSRANPVTTDAFQGRIG